MDPLLDKPHKLKALSPEARSKKLVTQTGFWASGVSTCVPEDLPVDAYPFMAREIALRPSERRPRSIPGDVLKVPLAGEGSPSLQTLGEDAIACAVFPMTDYETQADVGVVVDVGNGRPYLIGPPVREQSRSWELAWHVARALRKEPKTRLELAAKWILTGEVDSEGQVGRVFLGNKPQMSVKLQRTWLFPARNFSAGDHRPQGIGYAKEAANLQSALAHIRGQGVADGGLPEPWPNDVDVFHSFTSAALGPVLQAALYSEPAPVTLWTSKDVSKSIEPAEAIRRFLIQDVDWPPDQVTIMPGHLDSRSVADVERTLARLLERDLNQNKKFLFNITQGNLLMRLGVVELARRHSNVWLVYRDVDTPQPNLFELLTFEAGQPVSRQLEGTESDPRIQWDALRTTRLQTYTAEEIRGAYLTTKTGNPTDIMLQ